jgi:hypothetical protein
MTMPEGQQKDAARFMNTLYTAIDVVMAALPGGGDGGQAFQAAMATSHEADIAVWKALPISTTITQKQTLLVQSPELVEQIYL